MYSRFVTRRTSRFASAAFLAPLVLCVPWANAQIPAAADALLAIDQQRGSVVERIVATWGAELAKTDGAIAIDELRTRLLALRADRLFSASLAGSAGALREAAGLSVATSRVKPVSQAKALGDIGADVTYTPVTPCRLVDTRGVFAAVYQGNGTSSHTPVPFTANEIRTYTVQGGNGVCLTQLPASIAPSAVQLQVFGMPTTNLSGDIEILPQGGAFGSTATMVYVNTIPFNTVSTAARINTANKQISVQVRGGGAHVAIDVVGYFSAPSGTGGRFFLQGGNAFGTTASLGTLDNELVTFLANGQPVMTYMPNATSPNIVGGHPNNGVDVARFGQTIAGGGADGATCVDPLTFGARTCGNHAGEAYATVGGGESNFASGHYAVVAGGIQNSAIGLESAVGGGANNTASVDSATIAGGYTNSAFGGASAIAGGQHNVASGQNASVAGGFFNTASGANATVAGGSSNQASGSAATVAGGSNNLASGLLSFAAGHRAKATRTGTFMWADSREFDFQPSVDNFFGARATGGVGFTVAIDGTTGAVTQFCNLLPGTPSWQCTSDRNAKENFAPVDGVEILARLAAMPITTWNFKGADPALRALGPTAQDFYEAFGLGNDDKSIATSNLASVALAAIQGLHRIVQAKDARIDALEHELATQRQLSEAHERELTELERSLQALLSRPPEQRAVR